MTREEAISALKTLRDVRLQSVEWTESLDMAIEALSATQVWMPVADGLPNEYDEYLCQCGEGDRLVLWLEDEEWCKKYVVDENVVAWMPLPTPYKGGAESEVEE